MDVVQARYVLRGMFVSYFKDVNPEEVTFDAKLEDFNLPSSWLVEFVFQIEDKFGIYISDAMAYKHFETIRTAAKYLTPRIPD